MRRSVRLSSPPAPSLAPSLAPLLGAMLALAACSSGGTQGSAQGARASTAHDSARTGESAPSPGLADNAPALWLVSARGIGPVSAGMRFSDAAPLLGVPASASAGGESCTYVRPSHGPLGVSLMVRGGEIARVQVDSGDVRTTQGAAIGDSEARIDSLYAGRVTSAPHKYTSGHYLTVGPNGTDTLYKLVFETDGRRVTRYRAGRLPEVEWVEGCS